MMNSLVFKFHNCLHRAIVVVQVNGSDLTIREKLVESSLQI